jgi:hypothetical protein
MTLGERRVDRMPQAVTLASALSSASGNRKPFDDQLSKILGINQARAFCTKLQRLNARLTYLHKR